NFLLTNVNNLIQGQGNIGANAMSFLNQVGGVINANVTGGTLVIDPPNVANGFVNQGLLEATNDGFLLLTGNAGGGINNAGGTILADGAMSEVQLTNSASISGGTLSTANGGIIRNLTGQVATLSNLTIAGSYVNDNNADTHINGTINNLGSVFL